MCTSEWNYLVSLRCSSRRQFSQQQDLQDLLPIVASFFFLFANPLICVDASQSRLGHWLKLLTKFFLGSVTLFFWRVYLYFISFTKLIHCIAGKKSWTGTILRLLEGKPNEKGTEILPLVIKKLWLMTQLQFCVYGGGSDSLMPVLAILVSQTNIGPSNLWSDSSYCSQGFI